MSNYPLDWKIANLSDLATITASNVDKKTKEGQRDVLLCNYMDVFKNSVVSSSLEFMRSTASQKEISEFSVSKGDVLLTKDSEVPEEIGIPSVVIDDIPDLVCGYHLYMIRADHSRINPEYLCWTLRSNSSRQYFYQMANGSTRFGLNLKHIEEFPVAIPPLPEQKKIAEILSGIDSAIAEEEKILCKRERVAELLAVDLLNATKKEEMALLSDIATLHRGKFSHRPRNDPSFYGGEIPFIQTGDIPKQGVRISEFNQTLNQKGLGVSRLFPKGTLVITIAATIGEVGILDFPACFPDSLVGITPNKEKCNPIYLLFALRHFKKDLMQLAPQSAQSNLNLEILGKFSVPLPQVLVQNQIADIVVNQERESNSRHRCIAKLRFLRQAMLSDLLSGRKRVGI